MSPRGLARPARKSTELWWELAAQDAQFVKQVSKSRLSRKVPSPRVKEKKNHQSFFAKREKRRKNYCKHQKLFPKPPSHCFGTQRFFVFKLLSNNAENLCTFYVFNWEISECMKWRNCLRREGISVGWRGDITQFFSFTKPLKMLHRPWKVSLKVLKF